MNRNNSSIRRRKPDGLIPVFHIQHPDKPSLHGVIDDALYAAELQAELDKFRMGTAATLLCKGALTVNLLNDVSPQTAQAMQAIVNAYARRMVNDIQHTKEE